MPKEIATLTFPNDPIGILPDGKLNFVKADDPPFHPNVVDEEEAKTNPRINEPSICIGWLMLTPGKRP
jgi:hypothetical protein